jgi:hypothetical protein
MKSKGQELNAFQHSISSSLLSNEFYASWDSLAFFLFKHIFDLVYNIVRMPITIVTNWRPLLWNLMQHFQIHSRKL